MERSESTNISIIFVGASIAGLTFAIEAYRKGHNVRVFERQHTAGAEGEHEAGLFFNYYLNKVVVIRGAEGRATN